MSLKLPSKLAVAVTDRGLKLTVNSSEQCNLRCVYCYESFALGHMKMDVANGIIELIRKRVADGLDWLELGFFGGEPLGAWNVVKHITGNAFEICRKHDVKLVGGLTTNATLLYKDRLDWLAAHAMAAFQVTLDGPRAVHDVRRVSAEKAGTFDVIWQRLEMMRQSPFADLDVTIRVHYDARSWPMLVEPEGFLDKVIETFIRPDPRFKLYFHPVENWGPGVAEGITHFASRNDKRTALRALLNHASAAGVGPSQLSQLEEWSETGQTDYVCYAARANAFVIRADGAVSKCTVAFDDGRNVVGRLSSEGDLLIDHDHHTPWLRGLVTGDASALACPARGYIWPT